VARLDLEMVLASAVKPAMEIPTWSSITRIFFWWAAQNIILIKINSKKNEASSQLLRHKF
jgi:hypothetical protein